MSLSYHLPDCSFCHAPEKLQLKTSSALMSLPRIAPPSTPIHTLNIPSSPVTKNKDTGSRNRSAPATLVTSNNDYGAFASVYKSNPHYSVYPPFVTESQTGTRIPPRVNPLQPPPPEKLTTSLQTVDPHWHNEKRKNLMQQRDWYRYHGTWSKAFYGSPAEREAYRKKTRETLKQQMWDEWNRKKVQLMQKSQESKQSIEYDAKCLLQDAMDYRTKTEFLMQYRDDNKMLMEQAWARQRFQRQMEEQNENEVLAYSPINWSHTLK